jgi:thioredoxin-related protein
MKKILYLLCLCAPMFIRAQTDKGIHWTTGLSLEQVKEKAKSENKYIFLDCYTTWCGPCKMMDNAVYSNDSVGEYFNDRFISVKVQMDKTSKDNVDVKKWYATADAMVKQYKIEGYPSFIFLSPEGVLVQKGIGYRGVKEFIDLARTATVPGIVYDDPYKEYDILLAEYNKGNKRHDKYPFMIDMAIKSNDQKTAITLLKELTDSVSLLPPEKRYSKEIIQLWSQYTLKTDKPVFGFFYKDGNLIDKVMDQKGYSAIVVDRSIQAEIVTPYFLELTKETGIVMTGMYLSGSKLKLDSTEADWKKLEKMISAKFSADVTNRNLLTARVEWYKRHQNYPASLKYALDLLNQYPPNLKSFIQITTINNDAMNVILFSTDQKIILGYITWMQKVVEAYPNIYSRIDTYANLLYKAGRKKEAIQWEEKAVKMAPADQQIKKVLADMKAGKPTYLEEGAIWK